MAKAIVLSDYGPPEVLVPGQVEIGPPAADQIRVNVGLAGVGPTDLAIRSGRLKGAFGAQPGSVLGFEASGVVAAAGPDAGDVQPGDAVAVFLPELGGYAEQVLARYWVKVPGPVSPQDAAALPASGEAAARVVDEVGVAPDETVLIAGAAGSVGLIATQLAVARGARVLAAVRPGDFGLFHLIDAASSIEPGTEGGKPGGSPTIVVTWTLRSEKAWVKMDIRPPQHESAFSTYLAKHERVFRNYKCPRIVASGVR